MLKAYAKLVYRHSVFFLVFGLICMGASAVYATGIFNSLSSSGFIAANSQSHKVDNIVKNNFGGNSSSLVLVFSSRSLDYNNPVYAHAAETVIGNIADLPVVNSTSSYYTSGGSQFLSRNRHLTFALVGLKGNENQQADEVSQVLPWLKNPVLKVLPGGSAATNSELSNYVDSDLSTAEKISLPITAILLVIIFGSLTAASLPLALGLYGIIGALFISRLVTIAMPMSNYVIDIVCLLGLGLGIDYSLFIVSRYREELRKCKGREEDALAKTVSTAGKTVIFSGLTVMISTAGLIIFPINYIRSMGVGGASAVLIAVVGSLLFLPAILALLGEKVNSLKVSRLIPAKMRFRPRRGVLERIAERVVCHPLVILVVTLSVLLAIGAPFLRVHFISSNYSILPPGAPARIADQALNSQFKYGSQSPIDVLVPLTKLKSKAIAEAYVNKITSLKEVEGLDNYRVNDGYLLLGVIPKSSAYSTASEKLVQTIRQIKYSGIRGQVGGKTADLVDLLSLIRNDGIYALVVVVLAMLILFYLLLGSIVIPLKTIILSGLSLSAAFGVLVWIFQDGFFDGPLGISNPGGLDPSQLVIIFSLAFGLSMDYAAFLFSRIRENFYEHADMSRAIVWGVDKTGRIITSAALLMLAVISAFAAGRIVSMKEVAIGLIVAVAVDVFVVRLLLVPASMKLLGKYNWWLPGPLDTLYRKIHLNVD